MNTTSNPSTKYFKLCLTLASTKTREEIADDLARFLDSTDNKVRDLLCDAGKSRIVSTDVEAIVRVERRIEDIPHRANVFQSEHDTKPVFQASLPKQSRADKSLSRQAVLVRGALLTKRGSHGKFHDDHF